MIAIDEKDRAMLLSKAAELASINPDGDERLVDAFVKTPLAAVLEPHPPRGEA